MEIGKPWDAVVLSGSSLNLTQPICMTSVSKDLMVLLHLVNVPVLGVCFGMQLMAIAYGGYVQRMDAFVSETRVVACDDVAHNVLSGRFSACFAHGDAVTEVPPSFTTVAKNGPYVDVMESTSLLRFGVQFHPERSLTAPTIDEFMSFARRHKTLHSVPLYETLSTGEVLPWPVVRYLEQMMGRSSVHTLSKKFCVTARTVETVWSAFRRRFRVPAIML